MDKIYYKKIVNEEINPATGNIWTIEEVPERWRERVRTMLNGSNSDGY